MDLRLPRLIVLPTSWRTQTASAGTGVSMRARYALAVKSSGPSRSQHRARDSMRSTHGVEVGCGQPVDEINDGRIDRVERTARTKPKRDLLKGNSAVRDAGTAKADKCARESWLAG